MLLQYGAGLPIAYGRITPAQLYELLELHVYYRAVNDRPFAVEQRGRPDGDSLIRPARLVFGDRAVDQRHCTFV